jgi:hypothetical protein
MNLVEILKLTADNVRITETLKKLDEISSGKNLFFRPSKLTFVEFDKFYEDKQTKITTVDSDSDEESESMLEHVVSCSIS